MIANKVIDFILYLANWFGNKWITELPLLSYASWDSWWEGVDNWIFAYNNIEKYFPLSTLISLFLAWILIGLLIFGLQWALKVIKWGVGR